MVWISSEFEEEAAVMSSRAFTTARQKGKLAPLKFEDAVLRMTRRQETGPLLAKLKSMLNGKKSFVLAERLN